MARKFVDTSAVVKLYRFEPNSPAVRACVHPNDELLIASITPLEYRSAFYGMVRQRTLLHADALSYIQAFLTDLPLYKTVPMNSVLLTRAEALLATFSVSDGLRPLDAIQLASALEAHSQSPLDTLITTDTTLARIAVANGLTVKP